MKNLTRFSIILLFLFLSSGLSFSNHNIDRIDRSKSGLAMYEINSTKGVTNFYQGHGIVLEGTKYGQDYMIGPEMMIPALSGFYDWQTNGDCKHHILYNSPTAIHAIFMTSDDSSANFNNGRRSRYATSTDGGATWSLGTDVPLVRSGYPYLTLGNNGAFDDVAIIANHYGTVLTTYMHVDAAPLLGVFSDVVSPSPSVHIWPQIHTLTSGNVLTVGNTYPGGAAGDTIIAYQFDPTSGSWTGSPQFFRTAATDHLNLRWTSAAGPNGKAVIAISTISDAGGSYGANRVFYLTSDDNGTTWSTPEVLFDATIDSDGDTSTAWLGMDAVYDDAGNFYVTFNTVGLSGTFTSAKIWLSKNGETPVIVARNTDIPDAMVTSVSNPAMANSISMDWPSLSVSDDGDYVFCAYSVAKQSDTLNGFNSFDVFYSVSKTDTLNFESPDQPIQITSGLDDERYVSLNRVALSDGANTYKLPLSYQKDPQPGAAAFGDNAPLSRASLIYREITQAQIVCINKISCSIPGAYSLQQN